MNGVWIRALLLVLAPLLAGCGETPEPPDNLLLIGLDTVRFDAFLLPERAGITDALSDDLKQALIFTKAQSASSWTAPAVASVLTGLYPAHHGAGRFADPVADLSRDPFSPLAERFVTLTERLQEQDYKTVLITSHPMLKGGHGLAQGFDKIHARKGDDKLMELAQTLLQENPTQPFFLYVHLMAAHEWHTHKEGYEQHLRATDAQFKRAARDAAPAGICNGQTPDRCDSWLVYTAAVKKQRALVANLLDTLRKQGFLDSTLVVLYADHGEEFQEHGGGGHGQSMFQELLHVPLIVWHPDIPGQAVKKVVSLVDVKAAILNWLGMDVAEDEVDGRAIADIDNGEAFDWASYSAADWPDMERKVFASGIAYGAEQIAVFTDGWKYVWHEASGDSRLFNLRQDPEEEQPVPNAPVLARLEPALDRYFNALAVRITEPATLSAEQIEELKGVGYLQGADENGN